MARLNFNIYLEVHDLDEAADIVERLKGVKVDPQEHYANSAGTALRAAGVPQPEPEPELAEDPQVEAPKATRGRKAKETPAPASGSPAPTDAGGPSDLEKALFNGDDEPAAPQVDAAAVMAAMQAHITKHGAEKTMAVLTAAGNGAKSFKQIDASLYGAVYAALQAELP